MAEQTSGSGLRPDDERLAELLSLAPDDPRVREAMKDPERRAALDAYRLYRSRAVPAGADIPDAERRLSATLEREILGSSQVLRGGEKSGAEQGAEHGAKHGADPGGRSLGERLLGWLLVPVRRPAIGLATIVLVAGGVYLGTRGDGSGAIERFEVVTPSGPLRGATGGETGSLRTLPAPDGSVELEWPASAAGVYRITLLTPAYEPLAELGPYDEPRARLDPATLPPAARAHAAVFWQVTDEGADAPRDGIGVIRMP